MKILDEHMKMQTAARTELQLGERLQGWPEEELVTSGQSRGGACGKEGKVCWPPLAI